MEKANEVEGEGMHAGSRAHDAEAKMFEELRVATTKEPAGEFHFKVTHEPCPACKAMIFRFTSMRPKINVIQH